MIWCGVVWCGVCVSRLEGGINCLFIFCCLLVLLFIYLSIYLCICPEFITLALCILVVRK